MSSSPDSPDDYFSDTRMSFGDHLEELRTRLLRALLGLGICLVIGFVIDSIGTALKNPNIGIGRPMLAIITKPVKQEMGEFYERRRLRLEERRASEEGLNTPINEKMQLSASINTAALGKYVTINEGTPQDIPITLTVTPAEVLSITRRGETVSGETRTLTTLSVQEAFVVYFKVSLLCGVVLASPIIFYQFWAFIGAGLYPEEKRYIHVYLPFSLGLFLGGVLMCQFIVLPRAVSALLVFNEWLDLDPDLRLNEWLGFAIVMPFVFGLSFQTPLIMLFFERIGMFNAETYLKQWRIALIIMAAFAALATPTPDAISMMFLFVPMFGLYLLGIWLCKLSPRVPDPDEEVEEDYGV